MSNFLEESFKRWLCPSDRELTLRAKLSAGWSSRAASNSDTPNGSAGTSLNDNEQAVIAQVLDRANRIDMLEEERIRKLNERLEKIKRQACGDGKQNCILCNEPQPKFFSKFITCRDCQNAVCTKCSIDTFELKSKETVWLCKICSESRELLKKANLWTLMPSSRS